MGYSKMFVKAIKISKKSMFPIFRWRQQGNQAEIGVAGTGFFVNSNGYFISVAHAFDNADQNTEFLFIGRLPEQIQKPRLQIEEIARDNSLDILIGKVNIKSSQYFYLSKNVPEEGRSVCISGYPLAEISQNAQGGLNLGGVRRYFQPSFVLDKIVANSDNGMGVIRKHDGFLVRDVGLFGMSGGPVFDKDGIVVGVQASVTQPRVSKSSSGREISVENAIAISSKLFIDLLKENNVRFNLLGRL
ncbi:MAG: serine protease [Parcubacteria group bacterium]